MQKEINSDTYHKRCQAALKTGYTYIGGVGDDPSIVKKRRCDHGLYRRIACGHIRKLLHCTVAGGIVSCKDCVHDGYKQMVTERGMVFKSFSRPALNGTLHVDIVMPCGHAKSIQTGNLQIGAYHCSVCWLNQLKEDGLKYGIQVISPVKETHWNCILPCGCSSTLRINNLKKGLWSCPIHKTSYVYYPSGLYLIQINTENKSWLKLGVSNNITQRITQYGVDDEHTVDVLRYISTPTGLIAIRLEKGIHTRNSKNKLDSKLLSDIMKNSGYTECYPLEMLDTLLKELDNVETITKELNGN